MDTAHRPIAESSTLIERTGIPRKVLSRLLTSTRIGVGFRVLDVGCGSGELAAYFASLGVSCDGIDESPLNVIEARRAVPSCEFFGASASAPVTGPKGRFDLVLVRDASVFQTSLLSSAAFSTSLQLLSRVRPGGCLAFLARSGGGAPAAGGHRLSCFERHVGCLPGASDLQEFPDGLGFPRSHRSRTAEQNGSAYAIAVLRMPAQPLSQHEWKKAGDVAAQAASAPCCPWAVRGAEPAGFRTNAA